MSQKCVHKGCGKLFGDESEPCVYHPGPPVFHEGQKGWKCCKPRVLTFDEFLAIPPCTTGTHSTVEDVPAPPPAAASTPEVPPPVKREPVKNTASAAQSLPRLPKAESSSTVPAPVAAPESDSDEPGAQVTANVTCKRRGCNETSTKEAEVGQREGEKCVYHPGQAVFHEGSKGWSCCKRRVLEFDEFMKIEGCKERPHHCFVGKKKRKTGAGDGSDLEKLDTVRHDFYQTGTTVHASFFLKKIDKDKSSVELLEQSIAMDLKTQDGKWYQSTAPLFGAIDPAQSTFKVLGTKLELTLRKADGAGWPVLRSDEKQTGEIIQTGRAGRA